VWATLGLTLLLFGAILGAQMIALVFYAAGLAAMGKGVNPAAIEGDGLFLAIATCISTPVTVGLAVLFAWMKRSLPVRDYLRLRPVARKDLARWLMVMALFIPLSDCVSWLLGQEVVPEVMINIYQSTSWKSLLVFVMLVMAPIGEEFMFRGFMFEGLMRSKLGPVGAVVLTSVTWAAIHFQYGLYGQAVVCAGGLVLGWARVRTGSLVTPMVMHAVMNLVATAEMVWVLHGRGV